MVKEVTLIHGAGGELMQELIVDVLARFKNKKTPGGIGLDALDDGAIISLGNTSLVLTTDSHVVKPIFFPGGDIGRLAVSGTINDLAVMGAKPLALSSAMVMVDGFSIDDLKKIVNSMDETMCEAGGAIVTGDTKVVEKGAFDGIMINTTGIGVAEKPIPDSGLRPGNKILTTGTIGDHGFAILVHREGFDFETALVSDVSPIWFTVQAGLQVGGITAMKDPTRGGAANALNEMAKKSGVRIILEEETIPINPAVRAASEMLGIDPLEMANEGKAIIGVEGDLAEDVLAAVRKTRYGRDAAIIGEVQEGKRVMMKTEIGGTRFVETPMGDPVPRVC